MQKVFIIISIFYSYNKILKFFISICMYRYKKKISSLMLKISIHAYRYQALMTLVGFAEKSKLILKF